MTVTKSCRHCRKPFPARNAWVLYCSLRCRIFSKIDASGGPDSCWPWTAYTDRAGYGVTSDVDGKTQLAHRVSYMLAHGNITQGAHVCHRCDNPPCCNPSHLWPGTAYDNAIDRDNKGRHARIGPKGIRAPSARLSESDIPKIRRLLACGETLVDIGARFGVAPQTIHHIKKRETWNHIP